ncbi:N-formylglutamate amidohydrolase [Pedobacter sp. MC2016-14]|uniref:N-formylglutamate amidohydrolase n=1 Tax=Pedobacter sp. MC2016-14 TaxID=2897327 RepID=UPI001E2FF81A|nr:N-formylglutamate amidohydrolase [Pedobacter sp. MC2016-14]MCD0490417.1 N-formylglutamate amidohydrolase [Pedobacter sp. MC2016-14]
MNSYKITHPVANRIPILLSIPHCGTAFPDELLREYKPEMLPPDDTDWFVDALYDFATQMGITTIAANYSRWVIDLNRNPDSTPLYSDGRVITGLCTSSNFLGEPIYNDERTLVNADEVERRKSLYFDPYQQKVKELLDELKAEFGTVMLWDCHSIRRLVPSIQKEAFTDLILGTADGTSASASLIDTALTQLSGNFKINHNHPFKGGYITRNFGQPALNQHALQLEMSKDLYMDNSETRYDEARALHMQSVLKQCLTAMNTILQTL